MALQKKKTTVGAVWETSPRVSLCGEAPGRKREGGTSCVREGSCQSGGLGEGERLRAGEVARSLRGSAALGSLVAGRGTSASASRVSLASSYGGDGVPEFGGDAFLHDEAEGFGGRGGWPPVGALSGDEDALASRGRGGAPDRATPSFAWQAPQAAWYLVIARSAQSGGSGVPRSCVVGESPCFGSRVGDGVPLIWGCVLVTGSPWFGFPSRTPGGKGDLGANVHECASANEALALPSGRLRF